MNYKINVPEKWTDVLYHVYHVIDDNLETWIIKKYCEKILDRLEKNNIESAACNLFLITKAINTVEGCKDIILNEFTI